ncbi:MAG: hypothetical protein KDD45_15130 [Bdellovibrionales bacterium]|nr:hypothetical protein [Bdellovibrionales bacterium]
MKLKTYYLILILFFCSNCFSSALIDLNYIVFTDKNTVESNTSTSSSKSIYNICFAFSIDNKKTFYFGWGLYNVTTKDEVNQEQSNYVTQDMGPYFRYEFGRSKLYYFGIIYGIQTKTSFDTGGSSEDWLGTNYLVQLGVDPEVSDNLNVNFSLNYFSGASTTKVVSSVQTDVSYSKAFMSPSIGISYKW